MKILEDWHNDLLVDHLTDCPNMTADYMIVCSGVSSSQFIITWRHFYICNGLRIHIFRYDINENDRKDS